jgi:surface antigen
MKDALIKAAILATSISLVVSCSSTNTQGENTTLGAVGGAVVGGVAGAAVGGGAAVAVGIVGGALVGGLIGNSMDHSDYTQTTYALNNTTHHKSYYWYNRSTGTRYTVIPTSKSMAMYGYAHCRKFTVISNVNGNKHTSHGVACRNPNGSWSPIK